LIEPGQAANNEQMKVEPTGIQRPKKPRPPGYRKRQLSRINDSKGFIVAFSFTKGAHEEVARVKGKGLDIKLARVEDLLLGKVKI